ncbi:hypothetical protein SARC_02090 [Sphaeroforma arctica JP610]|uniref:Cytochrome c oxidase assembly protein COX16 homolog, mitochondrial n=1 Tax=Sphaeroforma arctica JP610 TaxID=667725 RepID=A0A0L0GA45_9EUKA|nr:hypothetical protein SARC_02090 [Sphaeroforma arctica JP610]KNC85751.1 hypothetical protein SARC_02090 [Sphaeroforma arctica JP610]|eukprot:XP_014159653.1 hypothetical protein SARC_02090 [Sphaeroforma arctica JP610]
MYKNCALIEGRKKTQYQFTYLAQVGGAYGLAEFTSTRYEKHEIDVSKFTKEQLAHLEKNKRKFDMQAEYERLSDMDLENWENVRVARPDGLEESLQNNTTKP